MWLLFRLLVLTNSFFYKLLILKSELSIEEVKHELNKIINKVEPDAFIEEKEHHHKQNNDNISNFVLHKYLLFFVVSRG